MQIRLPSRWAPRARRALLGALVLTCLTAPASARGGSALRVPLPPMFGEVGAATYDEQGQRVGPASMQIEQLEGGQVRIQASTGIDGAERTLVTALLAPTGDGEVLRPLRQESRSFDALGASLGLMSIDHERGVASCSPPGVEDEEPESLALPDDERVANLLLNLLFQPLVRGDTGRLDFQIFLCRGGARLMNGEAVVAGPHAERNAAGRRLVEVRYGVRFGSLLNQLARPFLPRLSSWFDPSTADAWVGHSMPLFANGPTVLVVRSGFSPDLLTETR